MPSLRVNGISFNVELIYSEGHICTASEAAELNKLRIGRIILFAKDITSAGVSGEDYLTQKAKDFRFTAKDYELPSDPFQIECIKIARSIAQEYQSQNGIPWQDAAVIALSESPLVQDEANRRIRANEEAAKRLIDMDFTLVKGS